MLKKFFIGLFAFLVALILIGFALPTAFTVEHQEHIVAAPKMIFVFIGDPPRWKEWIEWAKKDPQMEYVYSDPTYGVGATQKWTSKTMGAGSITVTEWSQEHSIGYDMHFEKWPPSKARMELLPASQGAKVKWTMEGRVPNNPLMRYMGLLMRWFIKKDLRKGLTNLKNLAESSIAAEVKGPWHNSPEETPKPETPPMRKPKTKNP